MSNPPAPSGQSGADPTGSTAVSRKDLEARIIAKAWRDPNYQAELLADPKGVLQSELSAIDPSIALPASLNVSVHSEAAEVYHLVVPRNPSEIAAPGATDTHLGGVSPQTVAVVVGPISTGVVIDGYIVTGPVTVVSHVVAAVTLSGTLPPVVNAAVTGVTTLVAMA